MSNDLDFIEERYQKVASSFDRATAIAERLVLRRLRRAVVPRARGRVLEVAVGTGQNLPFYDPEVVLTAVDLSPQMLAIARERAERLGRVVELRVEDAGALPFADGSFDSVVSTLAGCTFPDPVAAYREMWRVLRPGGWLLLAEHGRGESRFLGWLLDRLAPWHYRQMACHLNRDPLSLVRGAAIRPEVVASMLRGSLLAMVARKPS